MNIVLIGNKGQVGSEVQRLAETRGWQVFGFDADDLDITDAGKVEDTFLQFNNNAAVMINAAAYTAVDKAEDEQEKAFAVNCEGTACLASVCRKIDLPFLHISTDYVFSGSKKLPYTEKDIPEPLNVYGLSKLAGEEALQKIWEKHIILRVSWVFGSRGNNFVKTALRLAKEKESLPIVSDQIGCPSAALDVARVLLEISGKICEGKKNWGIYNYCGSPPTSWYDFACEIIAIGRKKYDLKAGEIRKIQTAEFPTRAKRPLNSQLLVEKICKDYDIIQHGWRDYLEKMIEGLECNIG